MRHTIPLTLALVLLTTLAAGLAGAAPPAQSPAQRVFLPQVVHSDAAPSIFGLEMSRVNAERGLDLVKTTNTRWVRRGTLRWNLVEPVEDGGYVWDHPWTRALEEDMITASQNGLNLIVPVISSPTWATAPYTVDCAPINPAKVEKFARFMAAAVERYSAPPFNIRYWEIGNEPDAPIFKNDSGFGCWGVEGDPYFGGRAFGEMLKVVVPAMKAVNPDLKILNGGLMLDRPYVAGDSTTTIGRFFEGMLLAGAGPHIDLLSFHTYVFYRTPGQPALGGREDWRIDYLRELTRRYQVPNLPLIRTETALLCVAVTPECRWAQADLVGRTYARTMRDGLLATIWYQYDSDSFHNTALIEPSDIWVPRPAYFAYRHTGRLLSGARYAGPIPGLPAAVEGYQFTRGAQTIAIYWTDDPAGVSFTIPVAAGARVSCTNRDGGPMACAPASGVLSLTAEVSPAFVVATP
jgi:hypothetical protein